MTGTESWDDFWTEVSGAGRTEVIRGVTVPVPCDLPLSLEKRVEELSESSSLEDYAELVGLLFGANVLDQWLDAGMGLRELQVVFSWGMAQGGGDDITFQQAYDLVQAQDDEDDGEGKAPASANRAARRAAQKPRSGSTGGPSKRTSSANTGSARSKSKR